MLTLNNKMGNSHLYKEDRELKLCSVSFTNSWWRTEQMQ